MSKTGIAGKVVAITGASGGVGEATALLLAQAAARVVLGARREERLVALSERIARAGGESAHVGRIVRQRADLAGLVARGSQVATRLDPECQRSQHQDAAQTAIRPDEAHSEALDQLRVQRRAHLAFPPSAGTPDGVEPNAAQSYTEGDSLRADPGGDWHVQGVCGGVVRGHVLDAVCARSEHGEGGRTCLSRHWASVFAGRGREWGARAARLAFAAAAEPRCRRLSCNFFPRSKARCLVRRRGRVEVGRGLSRRRGLLLRLARGGEWPVVSGRRRARRRVACVLRRRSRFRWR